ncbi:MAG TPA: hypothetical protein VG737_01140 [Cyclobacteriaceae bacterium]|nr:hypothetical protein [Cyclobacteriaceae bacterium]
MTRVFITIVGLIMLLSACTQRLACPAYQSSFIYDKDALRQKFSYFNEDSTPKILTASKSKYLIAVPESYRKKYRRMQTVEMKPVYPKIPDSLRTQDSDMALAEADEPDSAAVAAKVEKTEPGDSTYAITKTKEKFNLDQDLYMWYFREMLVLPDVRAAMENKSKENEGDGEGAKAAKKEKLPFPKNILNIFKKKEKTDSASTQTTQKKTTTGVNSPPAPEKKGGLFKKKKKEDNTPVKKKDPAKKKEEGDGF